MAAERIPAQELHQEPPARIGERGGGERSAVAPPLAAYVDVEAHGRRQQTHAGLVQLRGVQAHREGVVRARIAFAHQLGKAHVIRRIAHGPGERRGATVLAAGEEAPHASERHQQPERRRCAIERPSGRVPTAKGPGARGVCQREPQQRAVGHDAAHARRRTGESPEHERNQPEAVVEAQGAERRERERTQECEPEFAVAPAGTHHQEGARREKTRQLERGPGRDGKGGHGTPSDALVVPVIGSTTFLPVNWRAAPTLASRGTRRKLPERDGTLVYLRAPPSYGDEP